MRFAFAFAFFTVQFLCMSVYVYVYVVCVCLYVCLVILLEEGNSPVVNTKYHRHPLIFISSSISPSNSPHHY